MNNFWSILSVFKELNIKTRKFLLLKHNMFSKFILPYKICSCLELIWNSYLEMCLVKTELRPRTSKWMDILLLFTKLKSKQQYYISIMISLIPEQTNKILLTQVWL